VELGGGVRTASRKRRIREGEGYDRVIILSKEGKQNLRAELNTNQPLHNGREEFISRRNKYQKLRVSDEAIGPISFSTREEGKDCRRNHHHRRATERSAANVPKRKSERTTKNMERRRHAGQGAGASPMGRTSCFFRLQRDR